MSTGTRPREAGKLACAGWSFLHRPQRVVTAGVGSFPWTSVDKEAAQDPAPQSCRLTPWLSPSTPLPLLFLPISLTLGPFPALLPSPTPPRPLTLGALPLTLAPPPPLPSPLLWAPSLGLREVTSEARAEASLLSWPRSSSTFAETRRSGTSSRQELQLECPQPSGPPWVRRGDCRPPLWGRRVLVLGDSAAEHVG